MKSLLLAAGFATRMYPPTKNFPKPLLEIGGKTIIDRLLADIDTIEGIDEHLIVTNDIFYTYFKAWQLRTHYKHPITIINDGTICNECRKGAVCDILYVVEKLSLKEDLLVLAGDQVIDFSLKELVAFAKAKGTTCVTCQRETSVELLQKLGVLVVDESFKVVALFDKPEVPPTQWAVTPFCFFKGSDLELIYKAVAGGSGFDEPVHLVGWLTNHGHVHAWPLPGKRHRINDAASYEVVNQIYNDNKKSGQLL